MFAYLQSRIRGTARVSPGAPPPGLVAFYWHFARQTKGWYALMFVTSLAVALIDTVATGYLREGKRFMTIAIGCTGGKHRSVVMAEQIAERLDETGLGIQVVHRDLGRE